MSPVTCFCDAWRLEAAASYVEADVSADLPQLVTAAGYIEADVSAWRRLLGARFAVGMRWIGHIGHIRHIRIGD